MRRQNNAAGGQAEDQEEAQEVQLEEYPHQETGLPLHLGRGAPPADAEAAGEGPPREGSCRSVPTLGYLSQSEDSRTLTQEACRV
jgi:hypothetical protein